MAKFSTQAQGQSSYHIDALNQTKKIVGMQHKDLAKILKVTGKTISDTLGKNPKYLPNIAMVEEILEILEKDKPGAKLCYSLLLSGYSPEQANNIAFKLLNATDDNYTVRETVSQDQESEIRQFVGKSIQKIDLCKLIANDLDINIVLQIFLACLSKQGIFDLLEQETSSKETISHHLAEQLVYAGFAMGAIPSEVGANITPQAVRGILKGIGARVATREITDTKKRAVAKQSTTKTLDQELKLIN